MMLSRGPRHLSSPLPGSRAAVLKRARRGAGGPGAWRARKGGGATLKIQTGAKGGPACGFTSRQFPGLRSLRYLASESTHSASRSCSTANDPLANIEICVVVKSTCRSGLLSQSSAPFSSASISPWASHARPSIARVHVLGRVPVRPCLPVLVVSPLARQTGLRVSSAPPHSYSHSSFSHSPTRTADSAPSRPRSISTSPPPRHCSSRSP